MTNAQQVASDTNTRRYVTLVRFTNGAIEREGVANDDLDAIRAYAQRAEDRYYSVRLRDRKTGADIAIWPR
jgi:hypothetical protein